MEEMIATKNSFRRCNELTRKGRVRSHSALHDMHGIRCLLCCDRRLGPNRQLRSVHQRMCSAKLKTPGQIRETSDPRAGRSASSNETVGHVTDRRTAADVNFCLQRSRKRGMERYGH